MKPFPFSLYHPDSKEQDEEPGGSRCENEDAKIRSVNWHITSRCNYNCRFCFARDRGDEIHDLEVIRDKFSWLRNSGLEKVTFAGGEPLLHPEIVDFVRIAKELGFTTSIVTNGRLLDEPILGRLADYLDWVGISIDSSREEVERALGRGCGNHVELVRLAVELVHSFDLKLKINTVVTKLNFEEDMVPLIETLSPLRWKVFQCLFVEECNEDCRLDLGTTSEEFSIFESTNRRARLPGGAKSIFERNDDMINSYLMLSPEGNLTIARGRHYRKIGWDELTRRPLSDFVSIRRYEGRGGNYDWQ